jgi:hypothetical protein
MNIPPIVFVVLGVLFLVFGALRVAYLGRRRADRELEADTPEKAKARRRHLMFGVMWILTGVFLLVTTADIFHLRH